ncbi:MAG: hypothetical protein HOM16_16890, partial [Woeseia sp.]|nr:hypothetical protein [Woeseia sp.]
MGNKFQIDRRQLVKLGFSAGVLASLPYAGISLADDESDELLQFVSDSDSPIENSQTGTLSQREFQTLFTLCEYVNDVWQFDANLTQYGKLLRADLELKTTRRPSYLVEYRNALELIELVARNTDSVEQAWPTLLFSDVAAANFGATRLGRARRFVFSEIIAHQIPISGAFRSFGLVNYRG